MSAKDYECYLENETILEEIVQPKTLNTQLNCTQLLDLPLEVLELIFEFLPVNDLETCMNVCTVWRCILNKNQIWKKHCWYPEKIFKSMFIHDQKSKPTDMCKWWKNVQCQKVIWENWRTGRYSTTKTDIHMCSITDIFVDENGNYWLLSTTLNSDKILVWNITDEPILHQEFSVGREYNDLRIHKDKVFIFYLNHVKVFQFEHPEHKLKLFYSFRVGMNDILPDDAVVEYGNFNNFEYILVDKRFFIGYKDLYKVTPTDHKTLFIHVWDLESCSKIGTPSVYQKSFDNLFQSLSGGDVTMNVRMILSPGDNARFVVALFDDSNLFCNVSLFSITDMKIVELVTQQNCEMLNCVMKRNIIVVNLLLKGCTNCSSVISVFNVNTGLLYKLNNTCRSFIFDHDRVIFKVKDHLQILTISYSQMKEHKFKINSSLTLVKYFYPRFLLLHDPTVEARRYSVGVWDIDCGVKLWNFPLLTGLYFHELYFKQLEYPSRVLVLFKGERQLSLLKFDKPDQE